jgi:ribose transport system substrate-binding protein
MKSAFQRLSAAVLCLAWLVPALSAAPKIGVLLKGRSDFWSAVEKGAVNAGQKLGVEVVVKAPLNETDIAVQIHLLEALGAQGVQAIVIAPANQDTLAAPVAALAARGIKVVVIDSPLSGAAGGPFVGTNQRAAGEAAGRLLASLVGENDEVSVLKHSQGNMAAGEREIGALASLRAAHPHQAVHSDIFASSGNGSEAERSALLLDKYPGTKAILASGTPGTMAMLRLLEERRSAGAIKFVGCGFNCNPEVAAALNDGTMQGWVAQLPEDVGFKGVQAALALINGRPVEPVISTDFIVITKDNLQDPKVQALLTGG